MIVLYVLLSIWALLATAGLIHQHRAAAEWRIQFMIERGCDTQETREFIASRKNESQ